jgi:hypothetical protein
MMLFHFSPVLVDALDPSKARSKRRAVWLCDLKRVYQYAAQVARHQGCEVNKLWCYSVDSGRLPSFTKRRTGVFTCPHLIEVTVVRRARCLFDMLAKCGVRRSADVPRKLRFN